MKRRNHPDWDGGHELETEKPIKPAGPLEEKDAAEGVPVWSLATFWAQPDGSFTIVY